MRKEKNSRWFRCILLLIIFAGTISCVSGCEKSAELEDREYILALGIDLEQEGLSITYDVSRLYKAGANSSEEGGQKSVQYSAESFYDIVNAYGSQSDKFMDLNHLKAVIIGKELACNQEKLIELLQYIEQNDLFARNVKVFVAENKAADIFALGNDLSSSIGDYLENLYMNSNYYVKDQSTDVGKLISHWHNYDEILLVPILKAENEKPVPGSYALMQATGMSQELSNDEGNLVFLGNGVRLKINLVTGSSYAIQIDKVKKKLSISDNNGPYAKVKIVIKGHSVNQSLEDAKLQAAVESELAQQLEQSYAEFLNKWEPEEIDFFHTFSALSAENRNLWLEYRDKREEYNHNLTAGVEVEVELKDD